MGIISLLMMVFSNYVGWNIYHIRKFPTINIILFSQLLNKDNFHHNCVVSIGDDLRIVLFLKIFNLLDASGGGFWIHKRWQKKFPGHWTFNWACTSTNLTNLKKRGPSFGHSSLYH